MQCSQLLLFSSAIAMGVNIQEWDSGLSELCLLGASNVWGFTSPIFKTITTTKAIKKNQPPPKKTEKKKKHNTNNRKTGENNIEKSKKLKNNKNKISLKTK